MDAAGRVDAHRDEPEQRICGVHRDDDGIAVAVDVAVAELQLSGAGHANVTVEDDLAGRRKVLAIALRLADGAQVVVAML